MEQTEAKVSPYKHVTPLASLKLDLKVKHSHPHIILVMGRDYDVDTRGIYCIQQYFSHYKGNQFTYAIPLWVDTSGQPILEYKLTRLDKWMRKEWDKLCLVRGVRKGKHGRNTPYDKENPKITALDFLIHLQGNQHTY